MSQDMMPRILTARRGYEFPLDGLRLTMLSTQPTIQAIQEAFHFQFTGTATPPPTFGPVVNTVPPGLVFQVGYWHSRRHDLVPIRFLNIEPFRIVIDVAGPSTAVDDIYSHLREMLLDLAAPDGMPVLGEPKRILDYSEISVQLPFSLDAFFVPEIRELFARNAQEIEPNTPTVLSPSLQFQAVPPDRDFDGTISVSDGHTFSFSPRASTRPADQTYFSGAPLNTESHIAFVQEIADALRARA